MCFGGSPKVQAPPPLPPPAAPALQPAPRDSLTDADAAKRKRMIAGVVSRNGGTGAIGDVTTASVAGNSLLGGA